MATTLLLDRDGWDLCLDAAGNIAMASEPYSQTQDAASACRVFFQEAYYDTTLGIPYFTDVLGQYQPTQILRARFKEAALTVPGVTDATTYLDLDENRQITGQLQITTDAGTQVTTL